RFDRGRQGRGPGAVERRSVHRGSARGPGLYRRPALFRPPGRGRGGGAMTGPTRWSVAALLAGAMLLAAPLADAATAIVGARVWPVSSPAIERGTVVIGADGRIAAVGGVDEVAVPAQARRIDGAGLTVYPGLIDSQSSLGLAERDMDFAAHDVLESSTPVFPQGRVADAFNPDSAHLEVVRANGITHGVVAPGDSLPVTGQGALVSLAPLGGSHIVRSPLALHVNLSDRV